MFFLPCRRMILESPLGTAELARRLERALPSSALRGRVDEGGFDLHSPKADDRPLFGVRGRFHPVERGTRIVAVIRPAPWALAFFGVVWAMSGAFLLAPGLLAIGLAFALGLPALFFLLAWLEWVSLGMLLEAAGGRA